MKNSELQGLGLELVQKLNECIGRLENVELAKNRINVEGAEVCVNTPVDDEYSDIISLDLLSANQLAELKQIISNMLDESVAEARVFLQSVTGVANDKAESEKDSEVTTKTRAKKSPDRLAREQVALELRKQGMTFRDISLKTGISTDSIRKLCILNDVYPPNSKTTSCSRFKLPYVDKAYNGIEKYHSCPMCNKEYYVLYDWGYKRSILGKTYYFCSWSCLRKAEKLYGEFLEKAAAEKSRKISEKQAQMREERKMKNRELQRKFKESQGDKKCSRAVMAKLKYNRVIELYTSGTHNRKDIENITGIPLNCINKYICVARKEGLIE